jgi:hypothetical protein
MDHLRSSKRFLLWPTHGLAHAKDLDLHKGLLDARAKLDSPRFSAQAGMRQGIEQELQVVEQLGLADWL